jgi:hypothetical protein
MHNNFADWYRLLSIDPQEIPLNLRWQGVEAFSQQVDGSKALDLVRLIFSKAPKSSDFNSAFRAAFKDVDDSFAMRANELEMEVLAGATIANLLESDDTKVADIVALAVVCSDLQGLRVKPTLDEMIELAYKHLHRRSDELRTQLITPSIKPLKVKSPDLLDGDTAPATGALTWPMMQPVIEKLGKLPDKLVVQINEAFEQLSAQILLQQEESNMLWWLFSEHSRDLKISVSKVGFPAAALVAGKELADLTLVLPGPVAAEAFLDKFLQGILKNRKQSETTVRKAVTARTIKEWKRQATENLNLDELDDLCLIHFAIRQSAEAQNDSEWVAAYEKRAGVAIDSNISTAQLALQVYRERLLINAME